jgi:hypothetical protein
MASSKKNSSLLAALAPLHALAQLVPAASPDAKSASGSKHKQGHEHESAYILLTSLEPDAWLVHVGHPDGRWWNGAWRVADVEKLAVRTQSHRHLPPPSPTKFFPSTVVADEVCILAIVERRHVARASRRVCSAHRPDDRAARGGDRARGGRLSEHEGTLPSAIDC